VNYLRQPGFDDHFDLTDPWHIVGKTLALVSLQLKGSDEVLQRSVELLGWALYDKWEKVENMLRIAEEKKLPIASEVLTRLAALVETKLKVIEDSPDKTLPKPKLKRTYGMNLDKEGVAWLYAKLNLPDYGKIVPSVKATLDRNKLTSVDAPLIPKVEELLKKAIAENASKEVSNQVQLYQEWEKIRSETLLDQVQRAKNDKRLQEIEEQKRELAEREETIFFFDNEEEWMLRQPPAVRVYRMRWRGKYKPPKRKEDDTYVPPML
jgi:small subunit ribosomal protein S27